MRKKRLLLLAVSLLTAASVPAQALGAAGLTAQGAQQDKAVLETLLDKYPVRKNADTSGTLYAGLQDMDANGTPELVTAWWNSSDRMILHVDIHTIKDGKSVKTHAEPIQMWNGANTISWVTKEGTYALECLFQDNRSGNNANIIGINGALVKSASRLNTPPAGYQEAGLTLAEGGRFDDWTWKVNAKNVAEIPVLLSRLSGMVDTPVKQTAASITLDGKVITLSAYEIGGNNYFKLRDLAMMLNGTARQFAVGYDNTAQSIALTAGQPYTPVGGELTGGTAASSAKKSTQKLSLNSMALSLTAYEIGGNNYFKLRDLAQALDFGVTWDSASGTVGILSSTGYNANAQSPAQPAAGADRYASLSADDKHALNVFFTDLSEVSFYGGDKTIVRDFPAEALLSFAFRHNVLYRDNPVYHEDGTCSLPADQIDAALMQYFGFAVPRASAGIYTYKDDTYSCATADGKDAFFSVASSYQPLGDGSYEVSVGVYHPDVPFPPDYDVYALSKAEVDADPNLAPVRQGTAVIMPLDASDDSAWQLISYDLRSK